MMAQILYYLLQILIFVRYYIDLLIDRVFGFFYDSTRVHLPPASEKILLASATSLAERIRKGELKSEVVVRAFITRIKAVNGVLNAVVADRFEEAIKEAKLADESIRDGKVDFAKKPFLGVPFTAKESTACKGMANTFGLICRRGIRAEEDAENVLLMKQAGGILLGVTNVPSLNLWQETFNPIYGITKNPYNTTRNVGGSSGGEAANVAAGGSPIGLGTDIGGSVRIPCFMCGVYGHKTTSGLTSTKGLTFRDGSEKNTMVCSGPVVRYAEDLAPMIKVFTGDKSAQLKLDEKVAIGDIKIHYMSENHDHFCSSMRGEMTAIFQKVVDHFQAIKVDFENVKYGGRLWRYWMTQEENANFKRDIANRVKEVNPILEILKYPIGQSDYDLAVIFNLINGLLPAVDATWAKTLTKQLRDEILATLGTDGVLLFPSAPFPASYHFSAFLRPWNFHYFCIWNALQLPVTQVPLGLSADGLPLGLQVVAAPYQDRLCVAVARELERAFGGYVAPFTVD